MTKERAIEILKYIKHVGNGESEYVGCAQEIALDMAIKALEQEKGRKEPLTSLILSVIMATIMYFINRWNKNTKPQERKKRKMAEVRVLVNGNEYSEDEFKKDLTRMFDTYRDKNSSDMGNMTCNGVCCDDCPLYKASCNMKTTNSFKTIGLAYEWALKHPVATNRDKMIETFGGAYFNLIINYISDASLEDYDTWLNEEYKEPSKEPKNHEND